MKLYHGSSNQNKPSVIIGYDKSISENIFDGIFLSYSYSASSSHGEFVHTYEIDESLIASSADLESGWDIAVEVVANEVNSCDEDVIEDIAQLAIDDDCLDICDYVSYLYSEQDNSHAAWELQRIRGRIAAALGFEAVEMSDEYGTSYLLVK